jgi:hypothetical protein
MDLPVIVAEQRRRDSQSVTALKGMIPLPSEPVSIEAMACEGSGKIR